VAAGQERSFVSIPGGPHEFGVIAMTEPDGIQREQSAPAPKPSGIQAVPSPPNVTPAIGELKNCPHCDSSLAAQDIEVGRCWYCNKRLTDPVEPKQPRTPFLPVFFLGLLGAILGTVFGYFFTGETIGGASWTVSLCGGIGFACGSAAARSLFGKQKQES